MPSFRQFAAILVTGLVVAACESEQPDHVQQQTSTVPSPQKASSDSVAVPQMPAPVATAVDDRWDVSESSNDMDNSRQAVLKLVSENSVSTVFSSVSKPAVLFIRCLHGTTEVYVLIQSQVLAHDLDGYQRVRIRFDDSEPTSQVWNTSVDHGSLFAPSPIRLAQRLAQSDMFRIEYSASGQVAENARFAVAGLSRELGKIADACHWDSDGA
jgi:hypothetical protein